MEQQVLQISNEKSFGFFLSNKKELLKLKSSPIETTYPKTLFLFII
jgi:hypothetical protein